MQDVGTLIGKLHNDGFIDFVRLKDLICNEEKGNTKSLSFYLIDRETGSDRPRRFTLKKSLRALSESYLDIIEYGHEPSLKELTVFAKMYLKSMKGKINLSPRKLLRLTYNDLINFCKTAKFRMDLFKTSIYNRKFNL